MVSHVPLICASGRGFVNDVDEFGKESLICLALRSIGGLHDNDPIILLVDGQVGVNLKTEWRMSWVCTYATKFVFEPR